MTLRVSYGLALGALALGTVLACGSTESTFEDPNGSSSGDGTSSSGGFGDAGSSSGSSGGDPDLNACATDKQQGKLAPLDLLLMQDTSGSMFGITAGVTTKWDSVKQAMASFMADPTSAGIGIGVQFFPQFTGGVPNSCLADGECGAGRRCITKVCSNTANKACWGDGDCTGNGTCVDAQRCSLVGDIICRPGIQCQLNAGGGQVINGGTCSNPLVRGICENQAVSCTAGDYGALVAPISPLPASAAGVNAAFAARLPNGQTPTLAALTGAIDAARAHANANPGRVVSVILSTDGLPFTGNPASCDDAVASIAAAAAAGVSGSPSIKTFVIGVFAPNEAGSATPTLNQIAAAGGTGAATILGTSATTVQDFIAALQKIRGSSLPCELALPVPASGTPDYAKVNVRVADSATGTTTLVGYVGVAGACDPAKGGWYYDVKPTVEAKPTKVVLCPATCAKVQGDAKGAVEVVQGCETKTQDPPR